MYINRSAASQVEQVPVYPLDYRSSFLCPTLVNPGLVAVGHRVPMWRSSSRPPGEVAASGLGTSPGIAPRLASRTATARSPGRQPFWPTLSHLLHPAALQWPEGAERALSHLKPKKPLRWRLVGDALAWYRRAHQLPRSPVTVSSIGKGPVGRVHVTSKCVPLLVQSPLSHTLLSTDLLFHLLRTMHRQQTITMLC